MVGNTMKAIVLSAFWGLFYVVIWSDAVEFSKYKFETLTCDVTYGHVIATTRAFSAIHCSFNCKNRVGCVSSVLDVNTGDCYLNNSTKLPCDMVQGQCGKELKYIEKTAAPCESFYECKTESCLLGRCKLPPYYCDKAIEGTCLLNCTIYDDTFEYIYEHQYALFNAHGNVSLTECRELCLCESNITCSWFAYDADSTCTFADDIHGARKVDVSAKFYRRVCACP